MPEQSMKYADDTPSYYDSLIYQLEFMIEDYNKLLRIQAKAGHNEELLNSTLARMITISTQLYIKLEGCGTKAKDLIDELQPYTTWSDNLLEIKADPEQISKMPNLFRLILRAYDRLNISNI